DTRRALRDGMDHRADHPEASPRIADRYAGSDTTSATGQNWIVPCWCVPWKNRRRRTVVKSWLQGRSGCADLTGVRPAAWIGFRPEPYRGYLAFSKCAMHQLLDGQQMVRN